MTHAELVRRAERWLRGTRRCSVVAREVVSIAREVPDAIGWTSSLSILIECKATRADFLSDAKKPHRVYPEWGMGEERFYMTPSGLLTLDDLPPQWGLLEVGRCIVRVIYQASRFPVAAAAQRERCLLVKLLREAGAVTPENTTTSA